MIDASKARRFTGQSQRDVLNKVKDAFGADAVILGIKPIESPMPDDGDATWEVLGGPAINAEPTLAAPRARLLDKAYGAQRKFVPDMQDEVPLFIDRDADDEEDDVWEEEHSSAFSSIQNMLSDILRLQMQGDRPLVPEVYSRMYLRMVENEVGSHLARRMVETLYRQSANGRPADPEAVRSAMWQAIGRLVPTQGEIVLRSDKEGPTVVAFVGPTGVGKTTTVAKLAVAFRTKMKKRVAIISEDAIRPGGTDPLRMVERVIGVPMMEANTPERFMQALKKFHDADLILVDTAGRSPKKADGLSELQAFLQIAAPDEVHLVLPCTGGNRHLLDVAEQFRGVGYNRMVFTKLDEAATYGIILNVASHVDCALSYMTTGQEYAADIESGASDRIARLVLGEDVV